MFEILSWAELRAEKRLGSMKDSVTTVCFWLGVKVSSQLGD